MKKALGIAFMLCMVKLCVAQNTFTAIIKDIHSKKPMQGVSFRIDGLTIGGVSNTAGIVSLSNIPAGKHKITVSFVGYQDHKKELTFPYADTLVVLMDEGEEDEHGDEHGHHEELEEIVVNSTRSTRTIQNIPTRVEFIAGEELEEKGNMKPGDIRMLLNESTGIQTQQVSATSANASIRIQGLDGRYTQLLRDGFPMYAGFSGGLGLLQTPPLDLKQVEIIKGAASTLYGGGAIAGLVNLISKVPTDERETRFLVNGTTAGGLDVSGFHGQKFKHTGITVFASHNTSRAYDPSGFGFTAIPKTSRFVFNPKFFIYAGKRTTIDLGVNLTFEDRMGGDIEYIKGRGTSTRNYFEQNKSSRITPQFQLQHQFNEHSRLTVRNSFTSFKREITIPGYVFDGSQTSSYTEVAYNHETEKADWVVGMNVYTDQFSEDPKNAFPKRNYNQHAFGAFVQNTWNINEWLQMETGVRGDYTSTKEFAFLPRLSALFRISPSFTSRLGGGFGYKMPTIFTEQTERINYQRLLPLDAGANKLERSYGANIDFNYKGKLGDQIGFSINQLFYYTRINHPLTLVPASFGGTNFRLINVPNGWIDTKGWETNVKLTYSDFKLFIGHTYTDATVMNGLKRPNFLTAKHRLNNVLMYEVEGKWKIGLEAYYFSPQQLSDVETGRSYWIFGFMAEKLWKNFSLFLNFENFTDTRQTKFQNINSGTFTNPVFRDIYAPLDGFVVNGGVKFKL